MIAFRLSNGYNVNREREIASEGNIENVIEELTYFREEMIRLHQAGNCRMTSYRFERICKHYHYTHHKWK